MAPPSENTATVVYSHWASHSSCVYARWRHNAMKFLNKNVNDCVQYIILQKFTNFHAILSWSFQKICNEIGWPRFCATLYMYVQRHIAHAVQVLAWYLSAGLWCYCQVFRTTRWWQRHCICSCWTTIVSVEMIPLEKCVCRSANSTLAPASRSGKRSCRAKAPRSV